MAVCGQKKANKKVTEGIDESGVKKGWTKKVFVKNEEKIIRTCHEDCDTAHKIFTTRQFKVVDKNGGRGWCRNKNLKIKNLNNLLSKIL